MALYISEAEVAQLLTVPDTIAALEQSFQHLAAGRAAIQPRRRIRIAGGSFQTMMAVDEVLGVFGFKAYGMARSDPRSLVHLYSVDSGQLLAMVAAGALGAVRTGAASGLATRHMAREDAQSLGVLGTGSQALTQMQAVCAVRRIQRIQVFSRDPERREAFAQRAGAALDATATAAASAEECVRGVDVVVVITNSRDPVLRGAWLEQGVHVNAAGGNSWIRRELDSQAVQVSSVIAVDHLEQARMECGDLIWAAEEGALRWERVQELSGVVAGTAQRRQDPQEITLFESQGVALEDIAAADLVYRRARERGLGQELPF